MDDPELLELVELELRELLSLGEGLWEGLAVELLERWLPIEGFEVRGSARHTQVDNALGLHGEVRGLQEALGEVGGARRVGRGQTFGREHRKGGATQTVGALG